jgi:hypothetical protein
LAGLTIRAEVWWAEARKDPKHLSASKNFNSEPNASAGALICLAQAVGVAFQKILRSPQLHRQKILRSPQLHRLTIQAAGHFPKNLPLLPRQTNDILFLHGHPP